MKHRVLFKRALAVGLSVSMIMSMCTTGFAAGVDGSTAGSQETVSPLSVDDDTFSLDNSGSEGTETKAGGEEQGGLSGGTDSENASNGENAGFQENSGGGGEEKTDEDNGETEDSPGVNTTEGDDQDKDPGSGEGKTDEIEESSENIDSDENSGADNDHMEDVTDEGEKDPGKDIDESQENSDNINDNNQEDSNNNLDQITGGPSGEEGENTDDSAGSTGEDAAAGAGNSSGTVTVPEQVVTKPAAGSDKSDLERFVARYENFMEKYQADQDAKLESGKKVNYKTWASIKNAITGLLDAADEIEDAAEVQGYTIELKEIFIREAADEFARLAVKLIQDIRKEQENTEREGMPSEKELEELISGGAAGDFVEMVDGLIQEMNNEPESEEESGESAGDAEGVPQREDNNGSWESILEASSEGPAAEFLRNVNNLIYDMVIVLAENDNRFTVSDIKQMLDGSESVSEFLANFILSMQGLFEDIGLMLLDEAEITAIIEEAVNRFVNRMEEITNGLLAGTYSSTDELMDDFSAACESLDETIASVASGSSDDELEELYNLYDYFVIHFYNKFLLNIYIFKANEMYYSLESIRDEAAAQKQGLESLKERTDGIRLLQSCEIMINKMFARYETVMDDALVIREVEFRTNEISEKFNTRAYHSIESFRADVEEVRGTLEAVSNQEDERVQAVLAALDDILDAVDKLIIQQKEFKERYENIATRSNASKPETEESAWESLSKDIEKLLENVAQAEAEYYIFTSTEYNEYCDGLVKMLSDAALREFRNRVERLIESYYDKTPTEINQEIEEIRIFKENYLNQTEGEEKTEIEQRQKDIIKLKAAAFIHIVEKLEGDVENGFYKEYEGYYQFTKDMKEAESLLDEEVFNELTDEEKSNVEAAYQKLENLKFILSLAVTPEAQETWKRFNEGYEKLLSDYQTQADPSMWEWEKVLLRITNLQNLANRLPGELYNRTKAQRETMTEILSEEAKKEFDSILEEISQCEDTAVIRQKVKAAQALIDYISEISTEKEKRIEKLELILQRIALIENENTSEDVRKFLTSVNTFKEKYQNGDFLDGDEPLIYELLSEYERICSLYDALNRAEKELETVKEAWNTLEELWRAIETTYNDELSVLNILYPFLKAVEAFKEYYSSTDLWDESNAGNLILAYDECVKQYEELQEIYGDEPSIAENYEFQNAVDYLKSIFEEIQKLRGEIGGALEGGIYIVGQKLSVGDSESVAQVTRDNTKAFIQLIQTMEGSLAEMHSMCQRLGELVAQSGYENAIDIENVQLEVDALIENMDRIAKSTNYDNWHGLAGGQAYAETAWGNEINNPMNIEIPPMTIADLGLENLKVDGDGAAEQVTRAIETILRVRAELGARQNLSEHIVNAMELWQENDNSDSANKVGGINFSEINRFDDIPEDSVMKSSLTNARKMINNIQVFEGVLNEHHNILQRMNELAAKLVNNGMNYSDIDKEMIENEMKVLSEGLTFLAQYVNYDDWHGLGVAGGSQLQVPTGWYWDICHLIDIHIGDMTAEGLGVGEERSLVTITNAIESVSITRSILGAWQNTCEHIIELCEITLEVGPLIGNEFRDIEDENGELHHVPVKLTGWFDRIYTDMRNRIYELEIQKEGAYSDLDKANIDTEIRELNYGVDILIDLIKTKVETVPYVRLEAPDNDWQNKIIISENEEEYRYKLVYQSNASGTQNVCLIDHIEKENNSVYAGILTGVDIRDAKEKGIPLRIYVKTLNGAASVNLPEALKQEGGNWELIDAEHFTKWQYVRSIAFDFGDYAFGIENGESSVSVELLMSSVYGGKPGCDTENIPEMTEEGYVLYNTCKVYQAVGEASNIAAAESRIDTEVWIQYNTEGLTLPAQLPTTGGPGTMPIHMAGMMLLSLGACMVIFRKKERYEI